MSIGRNMNKVLKFTKKRDTKVKSNFQRILDAIKKINGKEVKNDPSSKG